MHKDKSWQALKPVSSKHGCSTNTAHVLSHISIIKMHTKPNKILLPVGMHAAVPTIMNMGQVGGQGSQRTVYHKTSVVEIDTCWESCTPSWLHQHTRKDLTNKNLGNRVYCSNQLCEISYPISKHNGIYIDIRQVISADIENYRLWRRSRTRGNSFIKRSRVIPLRHVKTSENCTEIPKSATTTYPYETHIPADNEQNYDR